MREQHSQSDLPTDIGVLVCEAGQVVSALGLAAKAEAQQAIAKAMALCENRTLFPVHLPTGPALGIVLNREATQVAMVRPVDTQVTLVDFVSAVPFAFDILEQVLNDPYTALTVADHEGTMRYISPVHEKFLGLPHGGAIGRPAEEAIPNSRLRAVIQSGKAEIGQPQKLANGVTRVVNRRPVWKDGRVIGAVGQVMFRDTQAVTEMAGEINQLRSQVEFYRRELDNLRETHEATAELIGESQAMQRLRHEIARVAKLDLPVLILGESGTGKELVAKAIHRLGRPGQALVSMNLAALPASLVESELFGHVAGAFTGSARQGRAGKLEMAHDGTLFLDEVGDIPADIQIKLLRVLEDHVVERLGSHTVKRTTFRLVAATHRNIDELICTGAFRHDLYYRISGISLQVPPLRERLEDIPALLSHFVDAFCQRNACPVPAIEADITRYLADQPWPGNLRQLRHRVEEALVFSGSGLLTLDAFMRNDRARNEALSKSTPICEPESPMPIRTNTNLTTLKRLERDAAMQALEACGGNKLRAAHQLGISRSYLYKLLKAAI